VLQRSPAFGVGLTRIVVPRLTARRTREVAMKGLIAFVVSIVVSMAAPLRADEIQITGGYLDVATANGKLFLFGNRGFTFRANVAVFAGFFRPGDCNAGPLICTPGTVVELDAGWSGGDLAGVATLDGITYSDVGGGGAFSSSMSVLFSGSVVMPAFGNASTTVSVPFSFSGTFSHTGGTETLHGVGTATLFLSPHPIAPGAWRVDRVVYRLASLLPPPWRSTDIGAVGASGFAGYVDGTFYVQGDGADIWGTADAFRFVYQPVAGDADIVARVTHEAAGHPLAKAGVMFRQSLDPSSLQVILDRKPGGELEFMARLGSGDITTFITGASSATPTWLRLTRSGSQFTAFQSADGATWSEVGSVNIPSAGVNLFAGLAVTSHDNAVLNTSVFDHVTVTMPVSVHNLLQSGDFEEYVPPSLGPPGWFSDNPLRQVAAKSESHQPHSGTQNGACWTTEFLDCGLYQEKIAPVTGAYTLRLFATADRPGGLVGANLNGQTVTLQDVAVRDFGDYAEYTMPFSAHAGDTIRVWMYSPPTPGYVVIDDVSLTLDQPVVITQGTWTIGPSGPGQLGRFTLADTDVQITGSYDGGIVEPLTDCSLETPCLPGQLVALRSFFENQTILTIASFARGIAVVGGVTYGVELGGALVLAGETVAIPTPTGTDFPEHVQVSAPFTFSGDLKGFEVLGLRDPRLVFDLPMAGHGTATLELLTAPSPSGPVLNFLRLTYTFEN
jgi:hypothetical protein